MTDTNGTTAAPESATPSTCPTWCVDIKPEHLEHDDEGDRLHKGPLFGGVLRGWGMESIGRPMQLQVDIEDRTGEFDRPDELQALARAAEEAAQWMEAAR